MPSRGRPKGESRSKFASSIRSDLMDSLRKISQQTGINQNKLLDRAIELLIEDFEEKGFYNPITGKR